MRCHQREAHKLCLAVAASEPLRIGQPSLIDLRRALIELLPQRDLISRSNLHTPTRVDRRENDVRRSLFLLPAITEDFHQISPLILTVLSRAHLRPIQPFPEFQSDWSGRTLCYEVGRIVRVVSPRQPIPSEVWKADFQIVQSR
jgi:hypothetical protein